ncbi:MAG: YdcF family protein [Myxococcales bacterium]|nr:YdcF family protein [Myxococcales bacterium]
MSAERRTVRGARLAWRRLRAAPLTALAVLGEASGLGRRADRAIGRASEGCLYGQVLEVPPRAWAIVPGAFVFKDGTPSDVLADRLTAALELVRAGRAAQVLVSGGPDEVVGMQRWLEERGVAAVRADPEGLRTWATMQRAAEVFEIREAVVCTQRFHLPRSLYLARAAGISAIGLVADRGAYDGALYNASRERLARMRAWLDVAWASRGTRAARARVR